MIASIVLAAGKSERMGRPKMSLPWGNNTVIGQVVTTLISVGLEQVVVVTGGGREDVLQAVNSLPKEWPVSTVENPEYVAGEMLSSLQVGVASLGEQGEAALIALGDQPQIEVDVVKAILSAYFQSGASLVIPSYAMRRGHPMLIARPLWAPLLALRSPQTLRDLIQAHSDQILYVNVDTPSVLQDLDTPRDYQAFKP